MCTISDNNHARATAPRTPRTRCCSSQPCQEAWTAPSMISRWHVTMLWVEAPRAASAAGPCTHTEGEQATTRSSWRQCVEPTVSYIPVPGTVSPRCHCDLTAPKHASKALHVPRPPVSAVPASPPLTSSRRPSRAPSPAPLVRGSVEALSPAAAAPRGFGWPAAKARIRKADGRMEIKALCRGNACLGAQGYTWPSSAASTHIVEPALAPTRVPRADAHAHAGAYRVTSERRVTRSNLRVRWPSGPGRVGR